MIKLFKKDHPEHLTTWRWIVENSDQQEQQQKVSANIKNFNKLYEFTHEFDTDQLTTDIQEAKELYGEHGWSSSNNLDGKDSAYRGFGLTWNPNKKPFAKEHQSVLGSNDKNTFTYEAHENLKERVKDEHRDTLGFNIRTKASQHKSIGTLLKKVKRTLVKSRISTIYGNTPIMGTDRPFHRDANVFIGTRVNIPIVTDKPYVFDLKTLPEPIHLKLGHAYSWDTSTLHRVISMRPCNNPRTHIVINVSPWWDWNEKEECWQTNQFYGQMHPIEMVVAGHIMDGISLC